MRKLIQTFIALGSWGAFFWFIYFIYSYEPQDKIHDLNRTIKHYTVEDGEVSKSVIYRRGLIQYLEKEETVYQRIWEYRYREMGYPNAIDYKPVGYYVLNSAGFDDWYKKLISKYNANDPLSIDKILFNDFNASRVEEIAHCLTIDENLTTAGMKRPIAFSYGDGDWKFYFDISFIFKERNNQYSFSPLRIYVIHMKPAGFWNYEVQDYLREREAKEIGYMYTIDDYGNVNYDIVKWFEEHKDLTGG